ncbi:hypothetical protein PLESTF_000682100 [Pleodorina starrii]|nr:hypothetical protein PLESTF_000682100 [Pleodorina starrii]
MGCGASKGASAESAVAPSLAKEKCSAAAPSLPGSQAVSVSKSNSGRKDVFVTRDVTGSETGAIGDGATSLADDDAVKKPPASEGLSKPPSKRTTLNVMVIAEPQFLGPDATPPEQPTVVEPEQRPGSSESENPARAAFRARFDARSPEDVPLSPIAFKSSRSLNRSIGVRRRTSDQGGSSHLHSPPPPPPPEPEPNDPIKYGDREDDDDKGPDPLREQFEMTKESNPLLAVGRTPTANGILSFKASEKPVKVKSNKRLAVGFALAGADAGDDAGPDRPASGGTGASGTGTGTGGGGGVGASACSPEEREGDLDLDPDAHLEAERIASVSAFPEERPAPVVVIGGAS